MENCARIAASAIAATTIQRDQEHMRNKVALMMTAAAILCAGTSAQAAVKETTLYSFTGGNDGSFPHAGVIGDSKGNLYGVTSSGGADHSGVVYELSPPKRG